MTKQNSTPPAQTGQFILQFRVVYLEDMVAHFQNRLAEAQQQLAEATGQPHADSPIPQGILTPLADSLAQTQLPVNGLSALTNELKQKIINPAVSSNGGER